MKIQINDKKGWRPDGLNAETVNRRVSKIKAYAKTKNIEVVSGSFWGVVPAPTTPRERLIETAVNRLSSGEKLYQEEIDA
jgi:hypothetical protein